LTQALSSHEAQFQSLVDDLAASCHGSVALAAIQSFLRNTLTKLAQREEFLLPRLMQAAIRWPEIKNHVWPESTMQEKNRFPFLQGDVIGTTTVLALGIAEISQKHDCWLVLSPDCDCVRASYVRVAPVFAVRNGTADDLEKGEERLEHQQRLQRFGHSLSLNTPKAFPLPCLPGDDHSALKGYFADLEIPYYLDKDNKGLATPYASMTVVGWHLLNGLIQHKETRAVDIAEAVAIRTIKVT
jgi:hypothetical protein